MSIEELVELIKNLPGELQSEVKDFGQYLRDTRIPKLPGQLKLTWRGALRGLRDRYASVELQHKSREWW